MEYNNVQTETFAETVLYESLLNRFWVRHECLLSLGNSSAPHKLLDN